MYAYVCWRVCERVRPSFGFRLVIVVKENLEISWIRSKLFEDESSRNHRRKKKAVRHANEGTANVGQLWTTVELTYFVVDFIL